MRAMEPDSFSAVVTDPPYGLEFLGKDWDKLGAVVEDCSEEKGRFASQRNGKTAFGGGGKRVRYGLSAASMQSWHEEWAREALRVTKPGGMILAFGGTRTHHRLACAIEDAGWEIRDCLMWLYGQGFPKSLDISKAIDKKAGITNRLPVTDLAQRWDGYGTTLKPAWEPIIVAMKPLDGTFAHNAEAHGVAGLNVNGCRIETTDMWDVSGSIYKGHFGSGKPGHGKRATNPNGHPNGRWPANLILDGDAAAALDGQSKRVSRYFYCCKASKKDRGEDNDHPTVKPTALMRWLIRLVTMPSGTRILDPFGGSGTTAVACALEGVDCVSIEKEAEYVNTSRRRIISVKDRRPLFAEATP